MEDTNSLASDIICTQIGSPERIEIVLLSKRNGPSSGVVISREDVVCVPVMTDSVPRQLVIVTGDKTVRYRESADTGTTISKSLRTCHSPSVTSMVIS